MDTVAIRVCLKCGLRTAVKKCRSRVKKCGCGQEMRFAGQEMRVVGPEITRLPWQPQCYVNNSFVLSPIEVIFGMKLS